MQSTIEQLEQMRQGVDMRFKISIRSFSLLVRPLSILENVQLTSEVASEISQQMPQAQNRLTEHTLLASKTLVKASTSNPDINDPKITEHIVARMTADEVTFLFKAYNRGCEAFNPALESLSEDDVKGLIIELKKNASDPDSDFQLTELSFSQLLGMAKFLVSREI